MFAVIYTAVGATVGAMTRNPVNGTIIVPSIWILDVFLGPAMGSADRLVTRGLPTHFVTLWMVDLPSGHGGRLGDLAPALGWTVFAFGAAWVIAIARTHTVQLRPRRFSRFRESPLLAAISAAWRDARRNPSQWILFLVVPTVFILTAYAVTPNKQITLTVDENGRSLARSFSMPAVHGATMAPIAVASLAAFVGLFALLGSHGRNSTGLPRRTLARLHRR